MFITSDFMCIKLLQRARPNERFFKTKWGIFLVSNRGYLCFRFGLLAVFLLSRSFSLSFFLPLSLSFSHTHTDSISSTYPLFLFLTSFLLPVISHAHFHDLDLMLENYPIFISFFNTWWWLNKHHYIFYRLWNRILNNLMDKCVFCNRDED